LPQLEFQRIYDGYPNINTTAYVALVNNNSTNGPGGAINAVARKTPIPAYACPSDGGPFPGEITNDTYGFYRSNYVGCTGSGDMYGNGPSDLTSSSTGPWGKGIFGVLNGQSIDPAAGGTSKGTSTFPDGLSNTVLFSEVISPQNTGWGGPIAGGVYGNMGGALFTTTITPNSTAPDKTVGPCPATQGDTSYKSPCSSIGGNAADQPSAANAYVAARSKHSGGVNVAMGDGKVTNFTNSVDITVWRALGTREGGEATTGRE
ncbi:MAG TPA: DUF1559 domain-containing protein, partial [Pirellulales bacterium]